MDDDDVAADSSPAPSPSPPHLSPSPPDVLVDPVNQAFLVSDDEDENETDDPNLSFAQLARATVEFIETAIHTILYIRGVYPPEIFVRRQRYQTPVYQSRHPHLNRYISGAMEAIYRELIFQALIEKVVMVIKNGMEEPLERFIFSIQYLMEPGLWDYDSSVREGITGPELGVQFRSFLAKLSMMESVLEPLDLGDDATFAIIIELKDKASPHVLQNKHEPHPWIAAADSHTTQGASEHAHLHMVRAVNNGMLNMSLSVQETKTKLDKKGKGKGKEPV